MIIENHQKVKLVCSECKRPVCFNILSPSHEYPEYEGVRTEIRVRIEIRCIKCKLSTEYVYKNINIEFIE